MKIDPSEITPEHLYLSRRKFIKGMGLLLAGAAASACVPKNSPFPTSPAETETPAAPEEGAAATETPFPWPTVSASQDELGDKLTPEDSVDNYNNYYEFSLSKEGVAPLAQGLRTDPWSVEVSGLVDKPRVFSMDDLLHFTQQERIYRMRCVEAWSMVIPWIGFPLAELLEAVAPQAEAQYVRFVTLYDPKQMPGQGDPSYHWPYVEGLRLDEAMHDLTILATGLYGKALKPQTGAPVRLVVPWKYGFKSIKSIVKIELVAEMPTSTWMYLSPREYGFYANVNPNVPHPRWSQATERRIGELQRRKTLLFNGYEEEVGSLYEGMDLVKWF